MEGLLLGLAGAVLCVGVLAVGLWSARRQIRSERRGPDESTDIARGLAHEIRNPLNTISITLQMLEEDLSADQRPEPSELLSDVQRVRGEVDRLEGILTDFQRYARLLQADPEEVNMSALVPQVLDFVEPEADRSLVKIERDVRPGLEVRADPALLRQAFLNLAINAFQAMENGGTLRVTAEGDDETVSVTFKDTGPGIAASVQERIFEPFYSTKRVGTGLGLAVVDHVARLHGGKAVVESRVGEGATFTLTLPRQGGPGSRK